jgi:hypothetical protein
MRRLVLRFVLVGTVAISCSPLPAPDDGATGLASKTATSAAEPMTTPVLAPTLTPRPTYTPLPTYTPFATYTPYPTLTPVPTSTPTPTSTPEPTETPLPPRAPASDAPAGPRGSSGAALLAKIREVKGWMDEYGGWIDRGGRGEPIDCREVVRLFDSAASTPAYTMPPDDAVLQWAHDRYREAIATFEHGARDLTGHCREWIAGISQERYLNSLEVTVARSAVHDAVGVLHVAVAKLEDEGY